MAIKQLYHNVPNCTGVQSIRVTESYNSSVAQVQIVCYNTSLSLGDAIQFNLGFSTDFGKIFEGFVRSIQKNLPEAQTTIICEDVLSKAVDYFMAADNPDEPFSRSNISTEDLVGDILAEAGISAYTANVPLSITWGVNNTKVEFNLTSAWLAAKTISDALAWHIYADRNGLVHLTDDHPYLEGGEVASFTWNDAAEKILTVGYDKSAEELRNRVVVYGSEGVQANASAASPYLPAGFYKTAVLATPVITSQSLAQQAANLNLSRFNRLTESLTMQVEGDYRIKPRLFASVTNSFVDVASLWFIYQVEHMMDQNGYVCNVTLSR